jgi:glycosyltransferase involved in cell wall biosynthesis
VKSEESASSLREAPIHVVLLLQDLEFGGTQRYAIQLLRNLDRSCFSPELWMLRGGEDMAPLAEETGVPLRWMSRSRWVGPGALVKLAWSLVHRRPRILYTLTVVPNIWGRLFGAPARVPVIIASWRSLYPKQHERWLWRLCSRVICNAHALKEIMVTRYGVDASRIEVIPNSVDPDHFSGDRTLKASEPTVIYVGRLVKEKDPSTLLEGFKLTSEKIPQARFEIVGNGYLAGEVRQLIGRYALEERVRIIPGRSDIRQDLNRAWVFAMASVREASPNVILEAMAMELPVVASRVGGIPELVEHGTTGLLFEAGDASELAAGLIHLLGDEHLRREMGAKAREKVIAHHTMEKMTRETERVFIEALNEVTAAGGSR